MDAEIQDVNKQENPSCKNYQHITLDELGSYRKVDKIRKNV